MIIKSSVLNTNPLEYNSPTSTFGYLPAPDQKRKEPSRTFKLDKIPSTPSLKVSLVRLTSIGARLSTEERSRLVLDVAPAIVFIRFLRPMI
jgi:hypothetical protein